VVERRHSLTGSTPDYVAANRETWNAHADWYAPAGERNWATEPLWGLWGIPEREIGFFPDLDGRDVLEDGCGTAYVSAWVARAGGRPVGLDNSPAQLATARRLQGQHDLHFPLIHGIAEQLPFNDASFDVVVSEYGAAIWSDPYLWIPEAARVLRPGGELSFLGNSSLLMMFIEDDEDVPAGRTMLRDYFGMHRFEWPADDDGIEFHLGHGDWIRVLRDNGFEILDLIELRPPEGAETVYPFVTTEWARRWPAEEVWRVRKR
jgi:SAM-dependent methyltransferase